MDNKDNLNFNFDDKYEEIVASMKKKRNEYEDIVSDSSLKKGKHSFVDISSSSSKKGFKAWWKRLTKGKKAALLTVTSLLLVIAIALGWFFSYFKYNYNSITTNPDDLGFSDVKERGVINVALFGVDSRDETVFEGNTDSIMVLSLNANTKKVKIFSIMRDTFVPMEYNKGSKYFGKINSAYSKGPEHAIKTLNQAFDLDISEYATVNFYGMTDIIDAVGGITATITQDELTWKGHGNPNLNNCMDEICSEMGLRARDYYIHSAGEQTLNGVQAVAYARVRHCTTVWGTRDDFGRTDRQRHVMQELFNKAITMKKTQYVTLVKALIPCSETSLSYADIIELATSILLSSPTFEQYRLPPSEYQSEFLMKGPSGYGSIIYYDLDYAAKMINSIIYDDVTMEEYIKANPVERNDWYSKTAGNNRRPGGNTTSSQITPVVPQEPEDPVESEAPEEPKEPEEPNNTEEPTESENPDDTSKPEEPIDPDDTSEPEEPKDPGEPTDPEEPKNPDDIGGTDKPENPSQPEDTTGSTPS